VERELVLLLAGCRDVREREEPLEAALARAAPTYASVAFDHGRPIQVGAYGPWLCGQGECDSILDAWVRAESWLCLRNDGKWTLRLRTSLPSPPPLFGRSWRTHASAFRMGRCLYLDPRHVPPRANDNCYTQRYHFVEHLRCTGEAADPEGDEHEPLAPLSLGPVGVRKGRSSGETGSRTPHGLLPRPSWTPPSRLRASTMEITPTPT